MNQFGNWSLFCRAICKLLKLYMLYWASRRQYSPQIIVWAHVTADGRAPIVFFLAILFGKYSGGWFEAEWAFQRDSARSHKAQLNQEWLKNKVWREKYLQIIWGQLAIRFWTGGVTEKNRITSEFLNFWIE